MENHCNMCSASQLREQKCYFFASQGLDLPPEAETAGDVRAWLGNFDNIASLAKLGARYSVARDYC